MVALRVRDGEGGLIFATQENVEAWLRMLNATEPLEDEVRVARDGLVHLVTTSGTPEQIAHAGRELERTCLAWEEAFFANAPPGRVVLVVEMTLFQLRQLAAFAQDQRVDVEAGATYDDEDDELRRLVWSQLLEAAGAAEFRRAAYWQRARDAFALAPAAG
jgi:hypothetical protein